MTRWRRHTRTAQDGFSLVEMLVGLALVALAVAMLPGSLKIAMQAWSERGEIERGASFTAAIEALEPRIEQALPLVERGRDGSLKVLFSGTGSSIEFIGPGGSGPLGPGLYRYHISALVSGDEQRGLTIETALYVPGSAAWRQNTGVDRLVIAGREAKFTFRYFGAKSADAKPAWQDIWPRADAVPLLVEISAELPTAHRIYRRRLVVAPRVALR